MGAACDCSKAAKAKSPEEELKTFHVFVTEKLIPKHSKHGMKDAFVGLGGGDDDKVTREEMLAKLKGLEYPGSGDNLFDLLDTDNEGFITKAEFVSSAKKDYLETGPLRDFAKFVTTTYGSVDEAFKDMDSGGGDKKAKGNHDSALSLEEFSTMLTKLKYTKDAAVVYKILDANQDSTVTVNEFKARLNKKK